MAAQILDAVGPSGRVLNIGAGSGNYEPWGGRVIAVEPSATMVAQRVNTNPIVRSVAEALPFADNSFDVALNLFTMHHWGDRTAGLDEMGRVSKRQVSLVYDTTKTFEMWLFGYYPEISTAPWEVTAPGATDIGECLEVDDVRVMWVPADCTDGFSGAY